MRKTALVFYALLGMIACNNSVSDNSGSHAVKQFPKPGTLIAHAETPVAEDSLNHFNFSVKVIADSNVSKGVYDVDAELGPNFVTGQFVLPEGAEDAQPVMRKGAAPNTYIIGFKMANDTAFNDYFEVSSDRKATKMRYIKSYSFESK